METNISIFENPEFGKIRIQMNASNEPMFCLSDVASALDIKNTGDLKARLSPKGIALTDTLTNGGIQQLNFINEGNLYKCIFKSRRPDAEKFQDWVCDDVLPTIRKTGGYVATSTAQPQQQLTIKDKMNAATWAAKFLNLNDASKLLIAQQILAPTGLILPEYTGSKGFLLCAGELLKKHDISINSHKFNLLMKDKGFVDYRERPSKSKGVKKFPVLTKKGLKYGENQVHPKNQAETQIRYYEDKFHSLLKELELK